MVSAVSAAAALAAAVVLAWTGVAKLAGSGPPPAALVAALGGREHAATAMRLLAAAELVVAFGLVAWPAPPPALVTALLGAAFLGYLAYARRVAPGSSCGCAGQDAVASRRSFLRAGWLVAAGGLGTTGAVPWWRVLAEHPVVVLCGFGVALAAVVACSAELDRWWLLPARRSWLRLRGHPLAGSQEDVPVAASVELVESSLAWQSVAHLVRSSLVEHWAAEGWRVLRYTGVHDEAGGGRPVSVLFAVDALARAGEATEPVVRVAVVDLATQEVIETGETRRPDVTLRPVGAM